jgi:hypothetical protein
MYSFIPNGRGIQMFGHGHFSHHHGGNGDSLFESFGMAMNTDQANGNTITQMIFQIINSTNGASLVAGTSNATINIWGLAAQ